MRISRVIIGILLGVAAAPTVAQQNAAEGAERCKNAFVVANKDIADKYKGHGKAIVKRPVRKLCAGELYADINLKYQHVTGNKGWHCDIEVYVANAKGKKIGDSARAKCVDKRNETILTDQIRIGKIRANQRLSLVVWSHDCEFDGPCELSFYSGSKKPYAVKFEVQKAK